MALAAFSLAGVLLKLASAHALFTFWNLFYYAAALAIMAGYAVAWQRILRLFPLSVAYAHRGVSQIWVLLWSVLIFGETLQWQSVVGAAIIVGGVSLLGSAHD